MLFRDELKEVLEDLGFGYKIPHSGLWLSVVLGFYLSLPVVAYKLLPFIFYTRGHSRRKTVSILVLGDIGHSPRMCYHALSFSNLNYNVNLCGYLLSEPLPLLVDDVNVDITPLAVLANTHNLPFPVFAAYKVLYQCGQLFALLFSMRGSDYFMIQNPPLLPLLAIVIVFVKLFSRNSRLVIDWHNLNYTILNLRYNNDQHAFVRLMRAYEKTLGKYAWLNLTVTSKLKHFLVDDFGLDPHKVATLYDRPGTQFHPLSQLSITKEEILTHSLFKGTDCPILVSSTSFTPDEDFDILLDALALYDETNKPLFVFVTGKGPLQGAFLKKVESLQLKNITIENAWLSPEEYPLLLAAADLGVSLHTSLSGLDLPMKIVDFFGAGVPVVTLPFPAIDELVKHGVNGFILGKDGVSQAQLLCDQIQTVFADKQLLAKVRAGAEKESAKRWNDEWLAKLGQRFAYD